MVLCWPQWRVSAWDGSPPLSQTHRRPGTSHRRKQTQLTARSEPARFPDINTHIKQPMVPDTLCLLQLGTGTKRGGWTRHHPKANSHIGASGLQSARGTHGAQITQEQSVSRFLWSNTWSGLWKMIVKFLVIWASFMGKTPQMWLQLVPQMKGHGNQLSSGHQDHTMSLKQFHQHFMGLWKEVS